MNANAAQLLLVGNRYRGFTNSSARTYRKNFFDGERDSVCGQLNDKRPTIACPLHCVQQ